MKIAMGMLALIGLSCGAEEIVACKDPVGRAFYHYAGRATPSNSGWTDDKISGAVFTLSQDAEGKFDVLYVDGRGKPISSRQEGGKVVTLRKDTTGVTVMVYYEIAGADIYTFYRETNGGSRFTLLQNRSGEGAAFPKSSVMAGSCGPMRVDLLK